MCANHKKVTQKQLTDHMSTESMKYAEYRLYRSILFCAPFLEANVYDCHVKLNNFRLHAFGIKLNFFQIKPSCFHITLFCMTYFEVFF